MNVAPDMTRWRGRIDALEGQQGQRWHQIVVPITSASPAGAIALLGFACDAGVARNHGRVGAKEGPDAIRSALGNMPVHQCKTIVDAGDVICIGSSANVIEDGLEAAQMAFSAVLAELLAHGLFPIGLGGGHEIAYGSFNGLATHLTQREAGKEKTPRVGIINLDAHFDLRLGERASSGTPFRQIAEDCVARGWPFRYCCLGVSAFANTAALFERAEQLGVVWRLDEDMGASNISETAVTLQQFLDEVDDVYFTICLDVLPASVMPGVSAPAVYGVALETVESLLDIVTMSGKLRLADVAELNPVHDIDNRSARIAARLVARIANNMAA
ncbi:formiminoglutamase [Collimonas sp. PA-H2]|uniref:formimidoylglutamase n=1 Tax=Collimonas sp. PA-H2 TaxID=1881062 RepID=UPI000BF8EBE4|nr:formimidoylglutamase [Collimonas sp. PA-H2]PFH08080.1 formiminoglutamase [Collimonas sp. PA-H2]